MSDFAKQLAQRAAEKISKHQTERNQPRLEAAAYADAVLSVHPKVKLPQLLKLEETRELMEKREVTKSILAEELAKARARARRETPAEAIKVPKKGRNRTPAEPAAASARRPSKGAMARPAFGLPALPFNQDSSAGRVSNGSITDL